MTLKYKVELTRRAARDIRKLPHEVAARIKTVVAALAEEPRPRDCLKLSNRGHTWCIRVGTYRVLYEIHEDQILVLVVRIRHRRNVYR